MRKGSRRPLTPEQQDELAALEAMPDEAIDTSDIPETTDWSRALPRGALYRPVKRQLTLRLDADVIEWFKAHAGAGGEGYQTAINRALRSFVRLVEARDAPKRK